MSVRIKFVLILTLVVSLILIISFLIIYDLFRNNQEQEFDNRLWASAYSEYLTYYNIKDTNKATLDKLNSYLPRVPVNFNSVLLNESFQIITTNPNTFKYKADTSFLQKIKSAKEVYFSRDNIQGIGLYINKMGKEAYVIATGFDKYTLERLSSLKLIMILVASGGILITAIFAFWYVIIATKPLVKLNKQMRHITESNLKQRIDVVKGNIKYNEIVQIATNYNNMLDRLEKAFQIQKNFVHHASHELRTPLATMLSQTESALRKELTPMETTRVLESLREDQQEMIDLTNSLLLLSQYESVHYSSAWPKIRMDELAYESIAAAQKMFEDINICFDFIKYPDKESYLFFPGNETLLRSALRNLIKNAYLYSDDRRVFITMEAYSKGIYIHFENKGRILNAEDKERLFFPFFRGENAQNKKGFGLGLSIVKRIAELHKGSINYQAIDPEINHFTLILLRP
jgi:signal transduction histidine kinase